MGATIEAPRLAMPEPDAATQARRDEIVAALRGLVDAEAVIDQERAMRPNESDALKARKVATLEAREPDVIAAGNIGCLTQIAGGTDMPVVHTVELLDWATGGPRPAASGPA